MLGILVVMGASSLKRNLGLLDTVLHLEADILAQLQQTREAGTVSRDVCEHGKKVWALLHYIRPTDLLDRAGVMPLGAGGVMPEMPNDGIFRHNLSILRYIPAQSVDLSPHVHLPVHLMYTSCAPHVHLMYTSSTPHVRLMYTSLCT